LDAVDNRACADTFVLIEHFHPPDLAHVFTHSKDA
jgi:hypothetical protein